MSLPNPRTSARALRRVFDRVSTAEARYVGNILRSETVGGGLLLAAAVVALLWANSPWRDSYSTLLGTTFGPESLHLRLNVAQWAADGLLAIFFFVAGVELKRELVVGNLRNPAKAVLPLVAAVSGVLVPAGLYLWLTATDAGARAGWAIPVATDIAFALAVLAVIGTHLPAALRSFLLTLAVVDDLVAILIIAVAYTSDLVPLAFAAAAVPLTLFGALARRRVLHWWLLVPLALLTWTLVHASGVHATVAGVLLAFTVPVKRRSGEHQSVGERLEHRTRPISAAVAVPLFALTAAGVTVVGGGLGQALDDPVFVAVVAGLVIGKVAGVFGGTWLTAKLTRAELDKSLSWGDVLGVSILAGIGFTVSLLIGELAFGAASARDDHVKVAVLTGSLLAATLAAIVLRRRNRHYRELAEAGAAVKDEAKGPPTSR